MKNILYKVSEPFVFINNALIPAGKAALQVTDLTIQRGYGIFDFFKTLHNVPVFLDDHLDRFYHSAAQMRLPVGKSREALKAAIQELMQQNRIPDAGVRITLTGGYSPDGNAITQPNMIITQQALQLPSPGAFQKGIRLVSYAHQRQMPEVKTTDYLMAIWLQPFIQEHGADEVLYQQQGIISECPRANFFIVTADDTVVTPSRQILKGINRAKILQIARDQFKVEERDLTLEEAQQAKEAFITSTTKHILPVTAINGHIIGKGKPGNVTEWLSKALDAHIATALLIH